LLKSFRAVGGAGLIHKVRARPSNNSSILGIQEYAIEWVRWHDADFAFTLASEMILERDALPLSRETPRKWMITSAKDRALHAHAGHCILYWLSSAI
jgi:hypothetical protein